MTDNIDLLAGKIAELADKLSGPGATAAIEATRIDGYSALAAGGVGIVFFIVASVIAHNLWKSGADEYDIKRLIAGVIAVFAILAGIVSLWAVADPWTWTTIAHPELRLAHNIISR